LVRHQYWVETRLGHAAAPVVAIISGRLMQFPWVLVAMPVVYRVPSRA
jgi:hypothetical protein